MVTPAVYSVIVGLVALERLFELVISRRNVRHQLARGGIEYGAGHYPVIVLLQSALLLGCLTETWFMARHFVPSLGYSMIGVLIFSQALRYWVVVTLGRQWTTRVIVVPGDVRVMTGPYRFLSHPNYLAVVAEGIALPLIHSNWITASVFSVANALVLATRIRVENSALREMDAGPTSLPPAARRGNPQTDF